MDVNKSYALAEASVHELADLMKVKRVPFVDKSSVKLTSDQI